VGIIQVFSGASLAVILLGLVSGSALLLQGMIFLAYAVNRKIEIPFPFKALAPICKSRI